MEIAVISQPLGRTINVEHDGVEFRVTWDTCERRGASIVVDVIGARRDSEFAYGVGASSSRSLSRVLKRLYPSSQHFKVDQMADQIWKAALQIRPTYY